MKKDVFCEWCKLEIKRDDKVACCNTYEWPRVIDERYFHLDCFKEWLDDKVTEKAKVAFNKSMKKIMPMIKPMAQNIANNMINNQNQF